MDRGSVAGYYQHNLIVLMSGFRHMSGLIHTLTGRSDCLMGLVRCQHHLMTHLKLDSLWQLGSVWLKRRPAQNLALWVKELSVRVSKST